MSRPRITTVPGAFPPPGKAYDVRPAGAGDQGHGVLMRRYAGGPWLAAYGRPAGREAFGHEVTLPAVLDLPQAAAILAELLVAYAAGCPAPGEHGPQCAETRHADRGDCGGRIRTYVAQTWVQGARPAEQVVMCTSHGRQGARRGEVRAL